MFTDVCNCLCKSEIYPKQFHEIKEEERKDKKKSHSRRGGSKRGAWIVQSVTRFALRLATYPCYAGSSRTSDGCTPAFICENG